MKKRNSNPPSETEICAAVDTIRKLIDGGYLDRRGTAEELCAELEEALNEVAQESGELEA